MSSDNLKMDADALDGFTTQLNDLMRYESATLFPASFQGEMGDSGVESAVADMAAKDGQLTARRFVFDTEPVRVDGSGTVDLRNETMALTLQGKPKSFQLVRLKAPITVTGKLQSPQLGVDAKPAITQGVVGAGLGFLSPLAALFAFIDPGLAKDADCAAALSDAKAQGAPVKAAAVRKAVSEDASKAKK